MDHAYYSNELNTRLFNLAHLRGRMYPSRATLNAMRIFVHAWWMVVNKFSLRLNAILLKRRRSDTAYLPSAGALVAYCAWHACIYRCLQNSLRAKCCKERRNSNTHARDMSHRFPLGPCMHFILAFPSVRHWSPICKSLIWYSTESIRISPQVTKSLLCSFANRVIVSDEIIDSCRISELFLY